MVASSRAGSTPAPATAAPAGAGGTVCGPELNGTLVELDNVARQQAGVKALPKESVPGFMAQAVLALEPDGERHLADYAQVLELLQAQFKPNAEIGHCRDWLAQSIEQAANNSPLAAELPYLASSHARIRIMTIHQSKGLWSRQQS